MNSDLYSVSDLDNYKDNNKQVKNIKINGYIISSSEINLLFQVLDENNTTIFEKTAENPKKYFYIEIDNPKTLNGLDLYIKNRYKIRMIVMNNTEISFKSKNISMEFIF